MVLGADGYVYSFGDNSLGQLGAHSKDTSKRSSTPVVAQGLNKVISISIGAGGSATKAVRYDGTLWVGVKTRITKLIIPIIVTIRTL